MAPWPHLQAAAIAARQAHAPHDHGDDPPHWPHHQRRLANCDGMPASHTSGQSSNPLRHPTCWASSQWNHTVSSTPCHGAWTSAPLSTHLHIECKCTAPQIETPICTRRTTTHHIHLTTTTGRITNGMQSGSRTLRDSVLFYLRHRPLGMTLPRRAWVRLNHLRIGVGRFCSRLHKRGMAHSAACKCDAEAQTVDPCCPPMSNPSISSWTARPDSSGRWDNRMVAQHLPRDLVRPSSGYEELAQTMVMTCYPSTRSGVSSLISS